MIRNSHQSEQPHLGSRGLSKYHLEYLELNSRLPSSIPQAHSYKPLCRKSFLATRFACRFDTPPVNHIS